MIACNAVYFCRYLIENTIKMEQVPKKHKKAKNVSREELLALTKEVWITYNFIKTGPNLYANGLS